MIRQIPYGRQHITEEDIEAVVRVLRSDFLTQGPEIERFEKAFASYIGARYAVAVANGTAALHLCALALGVGSSSKILTTPITFAASANCVRYCGGGVEFVDINSDSALMDLDALEKKLQSASSGTYGGVIPVHFAGAMVNTERLRRIADRYGLWILEDACHAPGGYFVDSQGRRRYAGATGFTDCSIFSFHPVKHIACGEGGMITTDREDLYHKLLLLRTHGITKDPTLMRENHGGWYYEMLELGFNYRLTDIQAALGISQLKRANAGLERRRQLAAFYDHAFQNTSVEPVGLNLREGHAFHLYVVRAPLRDALYEYLKSHNILAQIHYIPVHILPYYRAQGHQSCPHAESYYQECISLPMYPTLSDVQAQYVVDCILTFYKQLRSALE